MPIQRRIGAIAQAALRRFHGCTRDDGRELRDLINDHMRLFNQEHNITCGVTRFVYSPGEKIEFRLEMRPNDMPGVAVSPRRAEWAAHARHYGLPLEWLDREFTHPNSGRTYRISGLNVHRRSRPVCGSRVPDDKEFIFTVDEVKFYLEGTPMPPRKTRGGTRIFF